MTLSGLRHASSGKIQACFRGAVCQRSISFTCSKQLSYSCPFPATHYRYAPASACGRQLSYSFPFPATHYRYAPASACGRRGGRGSEQPQPTSRALQHHPHCRGSAYKRVEECPRGKSCRRADKSGKQAPPSPSDRLHHKAHGGDTTHAIELQNAALPKDMQ
jgi:hypothetical protein